MKAESRWELAESRLTEIESKLDNAMEAAHKLVQQNTIANQPEPVASAPTRAIARGELGMRIQNLPESTGESQDERIEEEWTKTNEILSFLCDEQVAVQDIFRTGKFKQTSPRPRTVIVRLTNAWQYRKILARCHRLKESQFDAYVSEEPTPEELDAEKKVLKLRYDLVKRGQIIKATSKIRQILYVDNQEYKAIA